MPEQNGIIERFFRSLKEECVWQQTFPTFKDARRIIRDWVQWYHHERPHSALGYRTPLSTARHNQPRWLDFRGALSAQWVCLVEWCPHRYTLHPLLPATSHNQYYRYNSGQIACRCPGTRP